MGCEATQTQEVAVAPGQRRSKEPCGGRPLSVTGETSECSSSEPLAGAVG
jgi:hypothetical protein